MSSIDQIFLVAGLIGALMAFSRVPGAIGAGMPFDVLRAMSEVEWLLAGFAAGIAMSIILGQ